MLAEVPWKDRLLSERVKKDAAGRKNEGQIGVCVCVCMCVLRDEE